MMSDTRWATAVRVLLVAGTLATTVALLEIATVRRLRAEVQQLREERDEVKAGLSTVWARQSRTEVARAVHELDAFFENDIEGLGRPGGLCVQGPVDQDAVATYALGTFVAARAEGRSVEVSLEMMRDAVRETDEFRRRHPELAASAPANQNAK